jgi:hypothetical protein
LILWRRSEVAVAVDDRVAVVAAVVAVDKVGIVTVVDLAVGLADDLADDLADTLEVGVTQASQARIYPMT